VLGWVTNGKRRACWRLVHNSRRGHELRHFSLGCPPSIRPFLAPFTFSNVLAVDPIVLVGGGGLAVSEFRMELSTKTAMGVRRHASGREAGNACAAVG